MANATITGLDRVTRNLALLVKTLPQEVAAAAFTEMEIEMAEMKERTPVDTGALRASGTVQPPQISPGEISVTLGFGGPGIGYAVPVHENTESFHAVGQAKYMESVLTESGPHLKNRIARRANLTGLVR